MLHQLHFTPDLSVFLPQVDYESDDDNEADDDDIPDQEEVTMQEKNSEATESQDEPYAPSSSQRAQSKRKESSELTKQRICAVLESHDAIESYAYDTDNELWCEVRIWK